MEPSIRQNSLGAVMGKKGHGKTHKASVDAFELERLIVIDPLDEFAGGYIFYDFNEFSIHFQDIFEKEDFRVVLKFTTDEEYRLFFQEIFEYHDLNLLIDEIDNWASTHSVDAGLSRLISYGRHRSISFIGIVRRPQEMNAKLRSQLDWIISFKQTEKRDLDIMRGYGFDPDELSSLDKREFIVLDVE
jgi:hypothetical protein